MKIVITFIFALLSFPAFAGSSAGPVTIIVAQAGAENIFVFDAGAVSAQPSCAAVVTPYWTVDLSTPGGRSIQTLVLTAKITGRSISVQGTGTCAHGRESAYYVTYN